MTYSEARERLSDWITEDGNLYFLGLRYLSWVKDNEDADLDGGFSADEFLAISVFMRGPDQE